MHGSNRRKMERSTCAFVGRSSADLESSEACNRLAMDQHGNGINSTAWLKAPNWMKRPAGAKFGFGGKLVTFQNALTSAGAQSNNSEVYVHALVTEQSLVCRSTEFESLVKDGERKSLLLLCERKYRDAMSKDELETWGLLKVLFEEDGTARTKLLSYLGFRVHDKEDGQANNEARGKLTNSSSLGNKYGKPVIFSSEEHSPLADDAEEFFENLQLSENNLVDENMVTNTEELKKQSEESETTESSIDEIVQRALVVGDHKGAVLQCIKADKMADALVIATISDRSLLEFTRDWYLKHSVSPYKKIVSALATSDLLSLINARPTNSWKESLALLCTYAQDEEWTMLCNSLASRLMTVGNTLAAALCYICAGNIDKTVEIWATGLKAESGLKTYIDILQDLMEKTVVFMHATGQKKFSASLSKLVENYAELLASQGLLTTAMYYLKLLNSETSSHVLAIFSNHIGISTAAGLKPVIETLMKLYRYSSKVLGGSSKVLGGSEANAVKRGEIYDNSLRIRALFAKLNSGDISSNVAEKLTHLCQALDEEDFGAALHIQVGLMTSDWDECNFWLAALKRMIMTVQKAKIMTVRRHSLQKAKIKTVRRHSLQKA